MKAKNKWLLQELGFLLLFFVCVNLIVAYGKHLTEIGEAKYDEFCKDKGNEKFLSIDDGHVKCYRADRLAMYEDYVQFYEYQLGRALQVFSVFNLIAFL